MTEQDDVPADFRGELLRPGDLGYDTARVVWNARVDRQPALIARCTGVADILLALAAAREQGGDLAVRGGGHDIAGSGVCERGIVIDLSPMKGVRVDPVRRTVRAHLGRAGPGDAGVRPGHDWWAVLIDGCHRGHARWRARLVDAR